MSNDNQTAAKPSARVYDSKVPPVGWLPEPNAGIVLKPPAVEVAAHEYDAIAKALIADLGPATDEARKVINAQRRGWVIERLGRRVFMRGRG